MSPPPMFGGTDSSATSQCSPRSSDLYLGTAPIGSIPTGWIISAGGARTALLVGATACLAASVLSAFVHTPPHPDDLLTDLGS